MAVPTPAPAPSPYSLGAIEASAVAFVGAFAGSELLGGIDLTHGLLVGLVAGAGMLGYHAYQSS